MLSIKYLHLWFAIEKLSFFSDQHGKLRSQYSMKFKAAMVESRLKCETCLNYAQQISQTVMGLQILGLNYIFDPRPHLYASFWAPPEATQIVCVCLYVCLSVCLMSCIISLFLSQLDQQHPLVDQLICSLLKDTRMNYSKLLRATTTGKKDIIKMGHHLISVTDYILSVDNVACACQLETPLK